MAKSKTKKVAKKKKVEKLKKVGRRAPIASKSVMRRVAIQKNAASAVFDFNNQQFKGRGPTILDALNAIQIPRTMIKTRVILSVSDGGKSAQHIVTGMQMKRIVGGHLAKEIWAKRLALTLR